MKNRKIMINFFEPQVTKPSDYHKALPNYPNAYVCASISELCYKSSVNAEHTDQIYKDKVISTLQRWGWTEEDAKKTIVINSREIDYGVNKVIPGTQGLIIFYKDKDKDKDIAFIGFRGSERKFNDWFTDFNVVKKSSKSPEAKHEFQGRIHRGFLGAFNAIVPEQGVSNVEFENVINQISDKQIWLTGHSLGGALASVAASYLLDKNIPIEGIYTFGAPRVGNPKYRDYLNKELTYKYWRFLNGNDLVPDIPLPLGFLKILHNLLPLGFSREGFMLRLTKGKPEILRTVDQNGTRKIWQRYHGRNARDHSMGNYRSGLFKLATEAVNSKSENKNIQPEDLQGLQMLLENELYLFKEEIDEIEDNIDEIEDDDDLE